MLFDSRYVDKVHGEAQDLIKQGDLRSAALKYISIGRGEVATALATIYAADKDKEKTNGTNN